VLAQSIRQGLPPGVQRFQLIDFADGSANGLLAHLVRHFAAS
jgi:hypothetical protein